MFTDKILQQREAINQKGSTGLKKRGIYTLIVIILAAVLCGCAQESAENSSQDSLPQITVGSDNYEPYNYISSGGEFTGVDVEIAREAFSRMGYEPVFKQIVWENKDEYLEAGEVDCLWGCFTMTGRENRYQWTCPYLCSRQVAVVRSGSDILELSDLKGKRIAVQATSKPENLLLERQDKRIPKPEMVYSFSTMDEVFSCLRKGYADAICGHESALNALIETSPENYLMLEDSLYTSELGVAFSKEYDSDFVSRLSEILTDMKTDGTIEDIAEKYGIDRQNVLEVTD